jgi:hypothetical protein
MSSVWEPIPPVGTGPILTFGPTTTRPQVVPYLYFEYFDTTINQPIFATQLSGTPIIWANSAGVLGV